ncbi:MULTISPECIES: MarR family winged helix-turn-helix transcriptional regulator [Streptomycetaceae]|uniref:MarR family transcriptional regulator n=1 Tax=Streptantibioticus cattleyicolor (strain ATCC 35852 / DSM 46488 / JCM 4925 / NBRC 14057 / NRRL 8057) TaxID=1003195 RepID=F8JS85_STREN|nr:MULTISPECIES: MarR family transcriptional regulator [Streptomycetaceae]AEW94196.1 MarR family transcriptional regulator [Streptantibioticus cattleyicolor NRRL 8057 = DSM 46488]MYS58856.1 MarR family transcriptional regulator [Streptomyces sp. SID5468]CCB74550.1 Transcriptional regulator, MarR family [Streptantibioticus cattleyicolor NRRL 8057 = DSM 46488]
MSDDPTEALAQGWCALAALHARIANRVERALQSEHGIGVTEYSVLRVLDRQREHHMRMQQLAAAVVLSQSATTRVVNKLEGQGLLTRYLCPTDRRGIYTEVTDAGRELLQEARPTNDAALREALDEAAHLPELAPLVRAVEATDPAAAPA